MVRRTLCLRIYFRQTSSSSCDKPRLDTRRSTEGQRPVAARRHVQCLPPPHLSLASRASICQVDFLHLFATVSLPELTPVHSTATTPHPCHPSVFMYDLHVSHSTLSTGIFITVCQSWSWATKRQGGKEETGRSHTARDKMAISPGVAVVVVIVVIVVVCCCWRLLFVCCLFRRTSSNGLFFFLFLFPSFLLPAFLTRI